MSVELDKLIISIQLEHDKFNQSAKTVLNSVTDLSKKMETSLSKGINTKKFDDSSKKIVNTITGVTKDATSILTKGFVGLGAILGVEFAADFVRGFASQGAQLNFLSSAFNIKPENAQIIQQLFKQVNHAGGEQNANSLIASLYKRLTNPQGDPGLFKALNALHINPKGINERDIGTTITQIITALSKQPKSLRPAITQAAGLPDEIRLLANLPADKLQGLVKSITKGGLISSQQTEAAAEEQKKWDLIAKKWEMISVKINTTILPSLMRLTEGVEQFVDFLSGNANYKDSVKAAEKQAEIGNKQGREEYKNKILDFFGIKHDKDTAAPLKTPNEVLKLNNDTIDNKVKKWFHGKDFNEETFNSPIKIAQPTKKDLSSAPYAEEYYNNAANAKFKALTNKPSPQNIKHPAQHVSNTSHSANYHIASIQMHGVNNPKEFASNLGSATETGWGFTQGFMA